PRHIEHTARLVTQSPDTSVLQPAWGGCGTPERSRGRANRLAVASRLAPPLVLWDPATFASPRVRVRESEPGSALLASARRARGARAAGLRVVYAPPRLHQPRFD